MIEYRPLRIYIYRVMMTTLNPKQTIFTWLNIGHYKYIHNNDSESCLVMVENSKVLRNPTIAQSI